MDISFTWRNALGKISHDLKFHAIESFYLIRPLGGYEQDYIRG
jgi:hypothetical protein